MYLYKKNSLEKDYYARCLTTMKHRGPDSQCLWDNNENYIAGFCRLAIRDLSPAGNQPMLSDCGHYCISFNGEIYNTGQLIQALRPYRSSFRSTTDTEILLYAFMHLGPDETLRLADGIFAIAFYNIRKNSLLLARDRLGIKPLYLGCAPQGIVYSSQYDHIINHPFFKSESLNAGAIGSYLSLGYVPENMGAVNNTKLLLHGYYYTVENGKIEQTRYYDYPRVQSHTNLNSLEETIYNAVQSQLVSDVPLGTFMSGGVDSTLVTWFANQNRQVNSFTIGIKDHEMDESDAAQQFAQIFNTNHDCKFFSPQDLLGLIDENTKAFSEPFADFSSLPTLMLSKFAKQKVTVALSGDGGDELFWGYKRNITALKNISLYRHSPVSRKAVLLARKIKKRSSITLARHWNEKDFTSYYYHTLYITGAQEWLTKAFNEEAADDYYFASQKNNAGAALKSDDDFMNMVRKLETDIHLQRILLKVDRASMYHSLEVRVPLLSNPVIDISTGYSYKDCIKGNAGKMPLKNILIEKTNRGLVMKPKKGFVIPMAEWMRKELKNDVTEKIMDMPPRLASLFNKTVTEQIIKQHMDKQADWSWFIWSLYSLVNWEAFHLNNKTLTA
jgi:asparagine synthase (glutamine-hydrolysing)